MPIIWDKANKRWRFEFDKYIQGARHRTTKLLPRGWSQAQADAFDRTESGRLYAIAAGIQQDDPLIETAVTLYLRDKTHLKSYKATAEHLAAIYWAYEGKRMSTLKAVADDVREKSTGLKPATVKQRLAWLKAACRWAWKAHGLTKHDPTGQMVMPTVRNERHTYLSRKQMLQACRACTNWYGQIAIRVAFYSGMRLGEIMSVEVDGDVMILEDTKNGDRRAIPVHPKISHLMRFLPLPGPRITIQRSVQRAMRRVGLGDVRFHDLRHSSASEMVNAGVSLYEVGAVLGHRDGKSTQRYAHLRTETLSTAINKIGRKRA
jgi:integrase